MKVSDLEAYSEYLKNLKGDVIRVEFVYPDDYIQLIIDNARLRDENSRLRDMEWKYCQEVYVSCELRDKLRFVHEFLKERNIIIPGFGW